MGKYFIKMPDGSSKQVDLSAFKKNLDILRDDDGYNSKKAHTEIVAKQHRPLSEKLSNKEKEFLRTIWNAYTKKSIDDFIDKRTKTKTISLDDASCSLSGTRFTEPSISPQRKAKIYHNYLGEEPDTETDPRLGATSDIKYNIWLKKENMKKKMGKGMNRLMNENEVESIYNEVFKRSYGIRKIYVNNNHVVVYFFGESEPVISAPFNEEFDLEKGILMCIAKYYVGVKANGLSKLCNMAQCQDKEQEQ